MSVYVDDAMIEWRGTRWCHMTADSLAELHAMADAIALRRSWFQESRRPEGCHYDVAPSYRAAALKAGAIEETTDEGSRRRRDAARQRRAALEVGA